MIDLEMWVLAADNGKVWRDTNGDSMLFKTKSAAQEHRACNLLGVSYDLWEPKKVRVTDANKV